MDEYEKTVSIAKLNDQLRTNFNPKAGQVYLTRGVADLPKKDQLGIIGLVQAFNSFSEDNDPYGEHDFGSVAHNGIQAFFKIDYYAPDMEHGSEEPSDPAKTVRVLTIMLANEY